jgi:hypothetical protein
MLRCRFSVEFNATTINSAHRMRISARAKLVVDDSSIDVGATDVFEPLEIRECNWVPAPEPTREEKA